MAIREGRWDCTYCGALGNLGRDRSCNNCGSSRPEGTKFYLADDSEIVDKKLERQAKIGPDWICAFCGTSNAADIVTVCGSCGSPRTESTTVQATKDFELGETPTRGDMADESEQPVGPSQAETTDRSARNPLLIAGAIGAFLLLCAVVVIAFLVLGQRDVDAKVSGFEWEREVAIEAYQTVTEEDWTLPSEGRLLSRSQEIHHYEQILDHYETRQREVSEQVQVGNRSFVCGQRDLGNGFFEDIECTEPVYETQSRTENYEEPIYREEPVYQTFYVYEIDKWLVERNETAAGRDHSPFWPRSNLDSDEREGEQSEVYTIYFTDSEGEVHKMELSFDEWSGYETGQTVKLKFNAFGDLTGLE
jgi:hypothetical protein